MSDLITVRASSADRIMLCNASSAKPELHIDTSGPWSNFGNAGHAVMAEIVKHDLTALPDMSKAIEEYGIEDDKSLRISCHIGLKEYVDVIRPSINRNHLISETKHSRKIGDKWLLTGHPDIACLLHDDETLFCGDWKLGEFANHWSQLRAYAYILLQYFPGATKVLLGGYFLRVNQREVKEFTREHIEEEWATSFVEALEGESFKPSWDSCKYCPILDCTVRDTLTRTTMASLREISSNQSTAVALASRYEDVLLVEKKIAQYKELLKDYMLINDEEITLPNGKVLSMAEGGRDTLYLHKSMGILYDYFGEGTDLPTLLKDCVTLKKTKFLDIVGKHAGRGAIGHAKRDIMKQLERVGAVERKTHHKLSLKKGEGK
jgi:hypothetical protein